MKMKTQLFSSGGLVSIVQLLLLLGEVIIGFSTTTSSLSSSFIFNNNNDNNNSNRRSSIRSLSSPSSSSSSRTIVQKLLRKARRLEDGGGNDDNEKAEEDMEAYLMEYSLKFMKCIPDQVLTDADYNDHFGVVIFRLCPTNSCSNNNEGGCNSGYADFAIDVGTYVEAFMEDQQDNMNWDDNFDGDGFGQCNQYENDDDGNGIEYYIGPGCTDDGLGVKMGLYEDKYCYEESETSFEKVSNGWSLPYEDGGLVSTNCIDCTDENDGEIREMCLDLYDYSPLRCESDIEYTHYYYDANFEIYRYGKDETGCTKIDVMQSPKTKFSSEAVWTDAILVVVLLFASVAGFYYYSIWWSKKKEDLEKIDDDEDDEEENSQYQLDDDNDNDNNENELPPVNESGSMGNNNNNDSPSTPLAAEGGTMT